MAKLQGSIAPAVGNTYNEAADRQAAYGKGFSGAAGAALDQSAADANALLAKNNSPQQIASQGGSARNVLYALGGYNPASVLNAQGAAFESAARDLPAMSRGLGVDAAKAANNAGAVTARDLVNKLMDVQAQRPGLVQQALQQLQGNQRQLNSDFQTDRARQAQLGLEAEAYGLNRAKFEADQQAQASAANAPNLGWSRALGVVADASGNPMVTKAGQIKLLPGYMVKNGEIVKRGSAKAKKSAPRLSALQVQKFRGTAATIAENAKQGFVTVDSRSGQEVNHPPIGYREALNEMEKEGIPTVIAIKALNKWYRADKVVKAKKPKKGDLGIQVFVPGERG